MEIRRLGPADAEAFSAVRLEALQKEPDAFGATYEDEKKRTLEEWRERLSLESPGEQGYFGAFYNGKIVGIIGFLRSKGTKERHKAVIVSMYVRESHRGSGLAAGLMNTALDYLRGLGDVDQVQLIVVTSKPAAIRFYKKMGFQPFGYEKRSLKVGEQYFDDIHMSLFFA